MREFGWYVIEEFLLANLIHSGGLAGTGSWRTGSLHKQQEQQSWCSTANQHSDTWLSANLERVMSGEEEIGRYLAQQRQEIEKQEKDSTKAHQLEHEHAQILTSIGRQRESLEFYERAFAGLEKMKNDFVWRSYYCNVGAHYAAALEFANELNRAEAVYKEIMSVHPTGYFMGDYAVFLHRKKRDFDLAQSFYKKALELYPEHSSMHLKYAGFLRHARRDVAGAEQFYLSAIKADPKNADALGNYASFLHGVHNKIDAAETYYEQAYKNDDTHTNNLCNYGLFLSEERKRYERAEEIYKRSLAVNASHANTLYNYAVMLDTHVQRKQEAEALYRRALEVEPRHAYALYNLAVLLEEKTYTAGQSRISSDGAAATAQQGSLPTSADALASAKDEICALYKRAVEADPRDATTMADYGRFLLTRMEDPDKAEPILLAAVKLDKDCEIALYNIALSLHSNRRDLKGALSYLRKLVALSPAFTATHTATRSAGLIQLARVLADMYLEGTKQQQQQGSGSRDSYDLSGAPPLPAECVDAYEKAIALMKEPAGVMSEYLKLVARYGSNKQKLNSMRSMGALMQTKLTALPINATDNAGAASGEASAGGVEDDASSASTAALKSTKLLLEKMAQSLHSSSS